MVVAKGGGQAPEFTLLDMQGVPRSLEQSRRQGPVVLAFFKVSCPTCQYTFPFLERLRQRLEGTRARIVGISQDAKRKTEGFNKEYGVRFPVLLDSEDEDYPVSNAYAITHVPTLFLIEQDGRVTLTSQGWVKADLEEIAGRLGVVELFHQNERVESFRAG